MDESCVDSLMKTVPPIALGKLLREFERTFSYFESTRDQKGMDLSKELQGAINKEYNFGVQWQPIFRVLDANLSKAVIVPDHIKRKYLECNAYCCESLKARRTEWL